VVPQTRHKASRNNSDVSGGRPALRRRYVVRARRFSPSLYSHIAKTKNTTNAGRFSWRSAAFRSKSGSEVQPANTSLGKRRRVLSLSAAVKSHSPICDIGAWRPDNNKFICYRARTLNYYLLFLMSDNTKNSRLWVLSGGHRPSGLLLSLL